MPLGELAALTAALLWAITSALLRKLAADASPLWVGVVRLTVASPFLALLALTSGQLPALHGARGEALAAITGSGVLAYAVGDTVYIRALGRYGMAAVFPASMSSFVGLTVLGGTVLLGEPVGVGLVVGGLAIVAGVWVLSGEGGREADGTGQRAAAGGMVAAVAAAAVFWAGATLWLTWGQEGLPPLAVGAVRAPAAAVALAAVALGADRRRGAALLSSGRLVVAAGAAGLLGTGIGSVLYVVALQTAGAARTALLSATSPMWGIPVAAVALGERPTHRTLVGTLLAAGGVALVVVL